MDLSDSHAASSSMDVSATPAQPALSHFDNCLAQAQQYKEAGNAALIAGNYQLAIGKYLKVQGCTAGLQLPPMMQSQEMSFLAAGRGKPLTPQQEQTLAAFLITVHLNMAVSRLANETAQKEATAVSVLT